MADKLQLKREIRRLNESIDYYGSKIYRLGDWIAACGQENYDGEEAENEANFTKWNDAIEAAVSRRAELKTLLKGIN